MRKEPLLDPRSKEDILREIEQKSRVYTPEWRFDGPSEDAGGALSDLFSGLFHETVMRYNAVPRKSYLDFLNLLDVQQSPVTPAHGTVRFTVDTGDENSSVYIPAGTQLYASETAGEENVPYFETDSSIEAVPASLTAQYAVDPQTDCIQLQPPDAAHALFFTADPADNLQKHRFVLTQQDVFFVSRPAKLAIRMEHCTSYYTPLCLSALADSQICKWTYLSGGEEKPFTRVYEQDGLLYLEKDNFDPIDVERAIYPPPVEEELPVEGEEAAAEPDVPEEPPEPERVPVASVYCTLLSGAVMPELRVKKLEVSSSYFEEDAATPDSLYFNEDPIEDTFGGYCFGRHPAVYDCFYISCGEVLKKRGARVHLSMHMQTTVIEQMTDEEQYEFKKKYIIDKGEKAKAVNKTYISQVVWEYWNGVGWKSLAVEGEKNPFSCQQDGDKSLWFRCPADMQTIDVNAEENYWLRARAAFVENSYDDKSQLYLPLVSEMRFGYAYDSMLPIGGIQAENNCQKTALNNAAELSALDFRLYQPLPDEEPAEYLRFDKPFLGHPVSVHFEILVNDDAKRLLEFQIAGENGFVPVRTLDHSNHLQKSGIVSLFINTPPYLTSFFGESGYWLRIVDKSARFRRGEAKRLVVKAVTVNAVGITQRRTMPPEYFTTELFEANKELLLLERSVLSATVWVNEQSELDAAALEALLASEPQNVRRETDDSGMPGAVWVRWQQVKNLYLSTPEDRHYTLDAMDGRILFGDGKHGKTPTPGENGIRVEYAVGGGAAGNLAVNKIDTMTGPVTNVSSVANFTPCCGGNDLQSLETLQRVGPMRLRHRNRALTAEDYENIVQELFGQVRDVRCFPGRDEKGGEAPGHVTVVIMAQNYENEAYARLLAEEVSNELITRCDMNLLAQGFLHVIPAMVITVSCQLKLLLQDYHAAVLTERDAAEALRTAINGKRVAGHPIGNLPNRTDVYAALKGVENVITAEDVLLQGEYYFEGKRRVISLTEGEAGYPYAVAVSGAHKINF